jgi:hypothetical protein
VDGEGVRLGERGAERGDEARVRRDAVDDRPLGGQVAVDGLGPDHE